MKENKRLSTKDHWAGSWSKQQLDTITFDPLQPSFRDLHDLFSRVLPKNRGMRFLEVGCHPGHYMWYFHHFFDYKVSGLEYVREFCDKVRKSLEGIDVPSDVICDDLFSFTPSSPEVRWDVVASFGLIEHFQDTEDVIKKHLALLKNGGHLVLVIPNHQGIYGKILKLVSLEKYNAHNLMKYEDILDALKKIGNVRIVEGGYYGHIGFWATGLYSRVRAMGRLPYLFVRGPLWVLERVGRILPNSAFLSPNAAVIAVKSE